MHDHRQPPSPDAPLSDLLPAAAHLLRRGSMAATAPLGLSPHQARALRVIAQEPAPVRMRELADALRVAPRSATDVVDGLLEAGLVTRAPDPHDRRAVVVDLTRRGRSVATRAEAARSAYQAEVFSQLSDRDQASLRRILLRLLEQGAPTAGG